MFDERGEIGGILVLRGTDIYSNRMPRTSRDVLRRNAAGRGGPWATRRLASARCSRRSQWGKMLTTRYVDL